MCYTNWKLFIMIKHSLCFQNTVGGNHTNNFAEAQFLVFKGVWVLVEGRGYKVEGNMSRVLKNENEIIK